MPPITVIRDCRSSRASTYVLSLKHYTIRLIRLAHFSHISLRLSSPTKNQARRGAKSKWSEQQSMPNASARCDLKPSELCFRLTSYASLSHLIDIILTTSAFRSVPLTRFDRLVHVRWHRVTFLASWILRRSMRSGAHRCCHLPAGRESVRIV